MYFTKIKKRNKILYISYDGILDSIGESQILSYLEKLSNDFDFYLITFEKKNKLNTILHRTIKERVKKSKIKWFNLQYHKQPAILSTLYDIIRGTIIAFFILVVINNFLYKYKFNSLISNHCLVGFITRTASPS